MTRAAVNYYKTIAKILANRECEEITKISNLHLSLRDQLLYPGKFTSAILVSGATISKGLINAKRCLQMKVK